MNENENQNRFADVPYIVFEGELARAERHIKRLWIALIVAIVALLACNCVWIWYINQYDFESYEVVAQGEGNANFIGNDGDIYNGFEGERETENEKESENH